MKKNDTSISSKRRKWRKSLLVMNLKVMLLLYTCLYIPTSVYAQEVRLTVKMENATLEQVIWHIQQETDFVFMYGSNDVAEVKGLNVNMKNKTISEILDHCLKSTHLRYEIQNNAIVIRKQDEKDKERVVIKGMVKDTRGEPLPGVTILEKGTSVGVATDREGRFTFTTVKSDQIVLVFSFVGMKTKEIAWKGQEDLNVVLEEEAQSMDEVVVTGYQRMKKSNMAGSVSTVKAEDLVLTGTQSLEAALQGKLTGVDIQNQSGLVGTRQKVRVRGTSTLLGSQEPVWVVDGIIQTDPLPFKATDLSMASTDPDNIDMIRNFVGSSISWLNPADIKDITVLKDASATAIYGVKAANGVIVINTKRGEKGRMSINYSGSFSIGSKVTYDKLDLMNSKERVDVSREIFTRGLCGTQPLLKVGYQDLLRQYLEDKISHETFNAGVKKLEVVNTDWFDLLYENPFSYANTLSMSGGNEKITYYASFGVSNNNGTAKGNDSKSYQGSVNVTTTFWNCLDFSDRVNGTVQKTRAYHSCVEPYTYASTTSRVIQAFDDEGELYYYHHNNGYKYNVLNELAESGNENTTSSLNTNVSLNWNIMKGLRYEMLLGYNYSSSHGESWATERTNYITYMRKYEFGQYNAQDEAYKASYLPHGGVLNLQETRNESYTWRNQLSYVKNFGRHLLTATLGHEISSSTYGGFTGTFYGYLPDRGKTIKNPPLNIESHEQLYPNTNYAQGSYSIIDNKTNQVSVYGALSYTFDERYVFNASLRSDASNRFGQDKNSRFLPVWSFGLRWNMGREHFFEGQNFLNECSFRLTYGYQGNASEAACSDLIARIPSDNEGGIVMGEYVLNIKSLPNPQLRWEKTATLNAGIDFAFWKNKINGSFEYYHKKTTDAIVEKTVPLENGVVSMPMNGGTLENSGWELSFSFAPIRTKNFMWSVSLNTSQNFNKVTDALESNKNWTQATTGRVNKEGYAMSSFWAFEMEGVDPKTGVPVYNLPDVDSPEAQADATVYMKYMGKLNPDFTSGLSMIFRYKNLSLSSSFYLSLGGKKFLAPMFSSDMYNDTPNEYNNLPKEWVGRWRKPGDVTNIPSLPFRNCGSIDLPNGKAYLYQMYNYTTDRVVNASYLRCNSISLSYNLSSGLIRKFAQNVGFSFNVTNPFTIVSSDFKGKDPEVASGSQPLARNYSFSMSLSF